MTVTAIGWIILPISLAAIVFRPSWVYAMAIFFLPFSATAVINLGSGSSASGMQAWLFLAILLIMRWAILAFFHLEMRIRREIRRPILYLTFFVAACGASLLMPLWINGRLQIMAPLLMDFSTTPLVFSGKNVTGFLYILIGFGFTLLIAQENTRRDIFRRSSYIYLLSSVFVALWGLLQLCLNIVHLPYPAMIFNNSSTPAASGYMETLDIADITRVTSVAVEPSMLVQTLLIGVAFTLPALFGSGHVLGKVKDRIACVLLILICIAATSSVGYLGLMLMLVLVCWLLYRTKRLGFGFIALLISALLAMTAAYFTIGLVRDIGNSALFDKTSSYSALERGKTIYFALQYFLDYPVLGVGWASVTSHDLVAKLLSNTGIIGFGAFCTFVGILLAALFRRMRKPIPGDRAYFDQASVVLLVACVEMLALATISEFPDVFGHFWFILGMGIAATSSAMNSSPIFTRRAA